MVAIPLSAIGAVLVAAGISGREEGRRERGTEVQSNSGLQCLTFVTDSRF
jgi:hypothetical protein